MIPEVLESVFQKAVAGDMTAAKMLLDRSLPTKRPEQECVQIPIKENTALNAREVLQSVFDGEVPRCWCESLKRDNERFKGC